MAVRTPTSTLRTSERSQQGGPAARGTYVDQPRGFDLFRLPGLRRLARWKYARFAFQVPLLLLAVMVVIDGLTGRQVAPRNLATTSVWLHYRGLVVIALALFGNAFCAACPLMLTRGLTRRLERLLPRKLAWPRHLRNKWTVVALLLGFFLAYEVFDLWASPWLTAWLVIGYFGAALAVDVLFPAGTFCRYVCPLGNFNFALASVSPTQVAAVDPDVCRACEHKPCLHGRDTYDRPPATPRAAFVPLADVVTPNGSGHFPGCETDLFVPTITSNMDCTYCFNCVRACPYDNVALRVRAPGRELARAPWARRGRLAVLAMGVLLAYWGLMNALAMISPFFEIAERLAGWLGTRNEAILLFALYGVVTLAGVITTVAAAMAADAIGNAMRARMSGSRTVPTRGSPGEPGPASSASPITASASRSHASASGRGASRRPRLSPIASFERWGYVVVALGFGFWGAHYLFHFLTGAMAIVPVFQHFFEFRGAAIDPNWRLAQMVPSGWLYPIQAAITAVYAVIAAVTAGRIGLRDYGRAGVVAMWPMVLYVLAFVVLQLLVLAQPMEMRGTMLMGSP